MLTYSTGSPCSKPSARHQSTSRGASTRPSKTSALALRPATPQPRRGAPTSELVVATAGASEDADSVTIRMRLQVPGDSSEGVRDQESDEHSSPSPACGRGGRG